MSDMTPFPFDADGKPINWSEESTQSCHHLYDLVNLAAGQHEYDQIMQEFKHSGLHVVRIQRLQNESSLEKFKSEMIHVKRRTSGRSTFLFCKLLRC